MNQTIQRKYFFDTVRETLFNGAISFAKVQGMTALINEYERREMNDPRWLAYVLGTVYHETAFTMQPIEEYGKGKGRKYGSKFRINGTAYTEPDHLFFGRGYVQLTWIDNYERMTKAAKRNGYTWDFVNQPELLLDLNISAWAAFHGMYNGFFTGKALADYFNASKTDWEGARKIINGTDKAKKIAEYAIKFHKAIELMPVMAGNLN